MPDLRRERQDQWLQLPPVWRNRLGTDLLTYPSPLPQHSPGLPFYARLLLSSDTAMADTVIMRDFKLSRDFRSVQWRETLWYNLLRAAGAGVVWLVVFPLIGDDSSGAGFLLYPIILPIGYLFFGLPLGLFLSKLAQIISRMGFELVGGIIGLVAMFLAFCWVAVGDPVVALLHRFVPQAVPVESPPLFSLSFITYVMKPETTNEVAFMRD